jgi:hypothetical protein
MSVIGKPQRADLLLAPPLESLFPIHETRSDDCREEPRVERRQGTALAVEEIVPAWNMIFPESSKRQIEIYLAPSSPMSFLAPS